MRATFPATWARPQSGGHSASAIAVAMLALLAAVPGAARPVAHRPIAAPDGPAASLFGPIATTATSRAYLGNPAAYAAVGYVEEEYFLKGRARVYDWADGTPRVKVVAGPGDYVTRILVRRPQNARRFSGRAEVHILNASTSVDQGGFTDFARMTQQGDAWIGITSKALTARALQNFDPVRYAPLDWANPAPPAQRCQLPTIVPVYSVGGIEMMKLLAGMGMKGSPPETEDGLVYDMITQLARVLKSPAGRQILPGKGPPRLYLTGISQSALMIRTWVTAFHDTARLAGGRPLYDGYLAVVGPAQLRLSQCGADVLPDDPRQKLARLDVPFISLSSEGETWLSRYSWQPDQIARRSGLVTYQIAGASHKRAEVPGLAPDLLRVAPPEDEAKAGFASPTGNAPSKLIPAGSSANALPWAPVMRGAWANLVAWAEKGIRPPQAPTIALDAKLEIRRDAQGNALGGLRMPDIEAPLASHRGAVSVGGPGAIFGIQTAFSSAVIRALYPTDGAYVAKFSAATDRLLAQRFILRPDAAALKASARTVSVKGGAD